MIPAPSAEEREALPESIWFCDFLWNRMYVNADGTVRPCCVPGVPVIGSFGKDGAAVWDNDAYRAMRIGLVRREPVAVCKGCQHIRDVRDPAEIDRMLQGRSLPDRMPTPPVLRHVFDAEHVAIFGTPEAPLAFASAPTVEWPAVEGADGYEFEAEAVFAGLPIRFDTAPRNLAIVEPRYAVPGYVWAEAPHSVPVRWQAIARFPDRHVIVARGCFVREG